MTDYETIKLLQQWRTKERSTLLEQRCKEKFTDACGRTNQIPANLCMIWSYDPAKGMRVTTNIGITMRETMNGMTKFQFTDFTYNANPVAEVGMISDDIDRFLKVIENILTK